MAEHETETIIIDDIVAMGAVRQVQKDKWKPSEKVKRYRAYRDELRLKIPQNFAMPSEGYHLTFYLPIPASWSKKKRAAMEGQPHQSKPDKDNLEKAFLDAILSDDAQVWDGRVSKRWSASPRIELCIGRSASGKRSGTSASATSGKAGSASSRRDGWHNERRHRFSNQS